jgi:pimeloyl-ACP methyl ester carboxylesterase
MSRARRLFALTAFAITLVNNVNAQTGAPSQPDAFRYDASSSTIKFMPCPEDPTLECGKLSLPINYTKPRGATFDMGVIRARAADPAQRIGVLMVNPGGPGGSGVGFLLSQARTPFALALRERFDLVSFDVRGSHRSDALRCPMQRIDAPDGLDDDALAAFFDDFGLKVASACPQDRRALATSMSTNNTARDMDALRQALGERQITFVGVSYGTLLGATYASLFPQRVRAMLLDSSMLPEFRDYHLEYAMEQGASIDLTLQRVDQLCRKDPDCALRDSGVIAAFDEVMAQLRDAAVTSDGTVLTDDTGTFVVHQLLHEEFAWPVLVRALSDARSGDYRLFFERLQLPLALVPVFPRLSTEAVDAIQCNDFGSRRQAADYLPTAQAFSALSPRFLGRPSLSVAGQVAQCSAWPAADLPIIRNVQQQLAGRILLVSTDFDPATPLAWTRRFARRLGMENGIVRYRGGGHVAVRQGSPCILAVVGAYLFNLALPEEGFSCPAQPISFSAETN